jgi:hypothetical protein
MNCGPEVFSSPDQNKPRPLHRSLPHAPYHAIAALAILLPVAWQATLAAPSYSVSIDTAGLSGQSGAMVFDLVNTSAASSSLTISEFTGGVTPDGAPALTGDAFGSIAAGFSLADGDFFNEVSVPVLFGDSAGFTLDFSFGTPGPTEFPDELSVFLLTPDESASLITTGDPTGADSILDYYVTATGAPILTTYDATDTSGVTVTASPLASVPEPSLLSTMFAALVSLLVARHKGRKVVCSVG